MNVLLPMRNEPVHSWDKAQLAIAGRSLGVHSSHEICRGDAATKSGAIR